LAQAFPFKQASAPALAAEPVSRASMRFFAHVAALLVLQVAADEHGVSQEALLRGPKKSHIDVLEGTVEGLAQSLTSLAEMEKGEIKVEPEEGKTEGEGEAKTTEESEATGIIEKEGEAKASEGEGKEGAEGAEGKEGAEGEEGEEGKEGEEKKEEGEEGEEGEEEEEEEEEAEFTGTDIQVSTMLLGGVAFVIMLFMLVNFPDDDIRRYAWTLISSVTSIFVAVMIFSSVNEWVLLFCETHELGGKHDITTTLCLIQYGHLFIWICILQLSVGVSSGSILEGATHNLDVEEWVIADALRADYGEKIEDLSIIRNSQFKKSVAIIRGMEIPCQKCLTNLDVRKRRMKCWGTLFAHMTGFAAINAGGTMQHLPGFNSGPLTTLIPIFVNQAFIVSLFAIFKQARDYLNAEAIRAGRPGRRAAMFSEEVMDSENDISCLAGSYMLVSSLRFLLAPHIQPNMLAEIAGATPWHSVYLQYSLGLAMSVVAVIVIVIKSFVASGPEAEEGILARCLNILAGMQGMAFAWACLFASRTVFLQTPALDEHGVGMKTISGRVLLALVLSLISTVVIFGLDFVGDFFKEKFPGKNLGPEIIDKIVSAFSILVGFSWEHAFDGGVEAIASTTKTPMITESILAGLVFIVIVPAWRRHILYKSMVLQDYYKLQQVADQQNDYTIVGDAKTNLPMSR